MISRSYQFIYLSAMILVYAIFLFHFGFVVFPLLFALLGIVLRAVFKKSYLLVVSFLIPILPAFAGFINSGFPNNYFILPLFVLTGIVISDSIINKEILSAGKETISRYYIYYLLILSISFVFVILRWSNLTLSPLAFFRDTPVAPTGHRISFGIIFPVVELALFVLSPLYYLFLRRSTDLRQILIAFLCGQSLSIFYSLLQRLQGKDPMQIVLNGFASDPTAFGFLSALAILLSWYLYSHYAEKWWGLFFTVVSLIGILNSATRVGLFAIVAVSLFFIFFSRRKIISLMVVGILLAVSLAFYIHLFQRSGTNLLTRLKVDFVSIQKSFKLKKSENIPLIDESDPRNVLWHYSRECMRNYPLTGVGAGNFVFWVMSNHKDYFFHHLPANQYFFITASTGLIGLSAFLLFCFGLFRRKRWPEKLLLGMFLFLLVFNDYLWFSEIFLVFWLFAALGEKSEAKPCLTDNWAKLLSVSGLLFFIAFNVLNFAKLHPKNWAGAKSTAYDYGFSYPEVVGGRSFRWSGENAGIYIFLDKDNSRAECKLVCGAPLSHLPGKKQAVDVYWRGKLYRRVVFRENGEYVLQVEDARHSQGFLEFRVHPSFNLKTMGLGAETRNLGVQVLGQGVGKKSSLFKFDFSNWRGPKSIRSGDVHKVLPPLMILGRGGEFVFSGSPKRKEKVCKVTPLEKGQNGETLIFIGFWMNRNGFNLKIEPGKQVVFRATLNLSNPKKMAAKLVIQDKTKDWEIENSEVDQSGWRHYEVTKRIRESVEDFICGVYWKPENQTDVLEIKEFQITVL